MFLQCTVRTTVYDVRYEEEEGGVNENGDTLTLSGQAHNEALCLLMMMMRRLRQTMNVGQSAHRRQDSTRDRDLDTHVHTHTQCQYI